MGGDSILDPVGWERRAIGDKWVKETKFVNRDRKVREVGLEEERLGGNIC